LRQRTEPRRPARPSVRATSSVPISVGTHEDWSAVLAWSCQHHVKIFHQRASVPRLSAPKTNSSPTAQSLSRWLNESRQGLPPCAGALPLLISESPRREQRPREAHEFSRLSLPNLTSSEIS
jgi:hypothetical protein